MKTVSVDQLFEDVKNGNVASLASAITLVESEALKDQPLADRLLEKIFKSPSQSFRLGISGAPGVGKSTFINQLGMEFIARGHKVAVLAIDPSSEITQGSILGDKTRMEELSRAPQSFIRPSASRGFLGGVHPATRDTIRICETAGYSVIIVETVGVGQSETAVADLVDYLLLLAAPGAGDELQGIKRGILEKIDGVVVNKADGDNKIAAELTSKQLQSALSILRTQKISIQLASSTEKTGIGEVCENLTSVWSKGKGNTEQKRRQQDALWLDKYLQQTALIAMRAKVMDSSEYSRLKQQVALGKIDVRSAAHQILTSIAVV